MILVTVGTSQYDPLIEAVDKLVESGDIKERVIAQIGNGKYEPKNLEFFRLVPNLIELIEEASVVITTGGAGTLFECMEKEKKVVAVENVHVSKQHQRELLYKLHKEKHILWCRDMGKLMKCLNYSQTNQPIPFHPEKLDMDMVLIRLFMKDENRPWWKFWNR